MMRLPCLLDAELREKARLHPSSLRLTLKLAPLSTAVMKLPPGEPEVAAGDFVSIDTPDGMAGIFRVKETERDADGTSTAWLEHGLCTLSDHMVVTERVYQGWDTNGDTGQVMTNGVVTAKRAAIHSKRSGSA